MDDELERTRASAIRLARVVEQSEDGQLLVSAEGRVLELNSAAIDLLGYEPAELRGRSLHELEVGLHEVGETALRRELARTTHVPWIVRGRALRRDRTTVAIEMRVIPLEPHELYAVTLRDTSEREAFDIALRDSVLRFRAMLESAPVGMITTSPNGAIMQANPAFQRTLGYSLPELRTRTLPELAHDPDVARVADALTLLIYREIPQFHEELRLVRKDGTTLWIDVTLFAEHDGSGVRQVVGVLSDVSERKRAQDELSALLGHLEEEVLARTAELGEAKEAAEEANRAKTRFLANMSHELRTPLNAILGYAEMLAEEAAEIGRDDWVADIDRIVSSGRHLLGLIDDVLDLSKIESGRVDVFLDHVLVAEVVDEALATTRHLAERNGNRVSAHVDESVGVMLTDGNKLQQILVNLLGNASKFTRRGQVSLTVDREVLDGVDHVRFAVSDTGIGMREDQIEKVFAPFVQADPSTTRRFGGTGLGLAICKTYCTLLGGHVRVTSVPGKGSTFTVVLPLEAPGGTSGVSS